MEEIRNHAYRCGYAVNYTFGITDVATFYPVYTHGDVFKVDMRDTVIGARKCWEILNTLPVLNIFSKGATGESSDD